MILEAFNKRTLQACRLLVDEALSRGMTLEQLAGLLRDEIGSSVLQGQAERAISSRVCPSCGRADMRQAKGIGERVLVCPACRYSEYNEVV